MQRFGIGIETARRTLAENGNPPPEFDVQDAFVLVTVRRLGPTLRDWRAAWQERATRKPEQLDIELPVGNMKPLGYVIMRHSIRLSRPVQAYGRWIDRIPSEYAKAVTRSDPPSVPQGQDPNCLGHLKDYRSLMPMAQEANCPMFLLKPAHGAIGAHQQAVRDCYTDFRNLAWELLRRLDERRGPSDDALRAE